MKVKIVDRFIDGWVCLFFRLRRVEVVTCRFRVWISINVIFFGFERGLWRRFTVSIFILAIGRRWFISRGVGGEVTRVSG